MEKFKEALIEIGDTWNIFETFQEAIIVSLLLKLKDEYPGESLQWTFEEKHKISSHLWEDFSQYCKSVDEKFINSGRWTNVQEYVLQISEDLFVRISKEVPATEYQDCCGDVHLSFAYPTTKTVTVYESCIGSEPEVKIETPVSSAPPRIYRVFDTETNGLGDSDVTVQVAFADCVLWENQLFVVEAHQFLIHRTDLQYAENVPMKIPQSFLEYFGGKASKWFTNLKPSAYIAFNADFDVSMLAKDGIFLPSKDVLCAFLEIPWKKKASLGHLCADHGILIHNAHNALTDVLATINLLNAQKDVPLEEFLKLAEFEKIILHADVGFKEKDLAKDKGYLWNTETRQWTKKIRKCHLKEPLELWEILKPLEGSKYEEL
jgi:hypothetical protein